MCSAEVASRLQSQETRIILRRSSLAERFLDVDFDGDGNLDVVLTPVRVWVQVHVAVAVNVHVKDYVNVDGMDTPAQRI